MRIRKDVWGLTNAAGDWPQELTEYAQAVAAMRELDPPGNGKPTDPLSWKFQAAIHGRDRPNGSPDDSNEFWNDCQHGSWFFLAWHRMYLCAFESIIQHFLDDEPRSRRGDGFELRSQLTQVGQRIEQAVDMIDTHAV